MDAFSKLENTLIRNINGKHPLFFGGQKALEIIVKLTYDQIEENTYVKFVCLAIGNITAVGYTQECSIEDLVDHFDLITRDVIDGKFSPSMDLHTSLSSCLKKFPAPATWEIVSDKIEAIRNLKCENLEITYKKQRDVSLYN
jgi:hypothetical protein